MASKYSYDYVPEGSLLTFIEEKPKALNSQGKYTRYAKYHCECGTISEHRIADVKFGGVKSCGCFKRKALIARNIKHGFSHHPLHGVWRSIISRCYSKNAFNYKMYGGIGVRMCEEWVTDFKAFYDWCMVNGWRTGLQIDKDIKARSVGVEPLLYSPEWCSIVTASQNSRATKRNVNVTFNDETKNLTEWGEALNIHPSIIRYRLFRGWSIEDAFLTPTTLALKQIKNHFKTTT